MKGWPLAIRVWDGMALKGDADALATSAFYLNWKRNGIAIYPSHSLSP